MAPHDTEIRPDDIAVIGLGGRFPGGLGVSALWRALRAGEEGISHFSDQDLAAAGVPRALREDPAYVPARAVLDEESVRGFDERFFELSPREAATTDPQQRLFLECAWEALEESGYPPGTFGGRAGVYAGASLSDYLLQNLHSRLGVTSANALEILFGNDKDYLATRVSYRLDLRGPALTIQTACSTSLVAVHLACQGLLERECDLAVAGGVSINLPQKTGYLYQEGMILSPDGHCRPFDADAAGTVQGNGAGVVVLKRLDEAVADRDTVRAVLKGTAINNDGALKVGFTAPSVEGQAGVIEEALAMAGVEPASIGYVEAHGTGTAMGDPIEIAALHDVFSGVERGSVGIGSIKSNLGHLGAAAGVAGLIKAILAVERSELPPSLHFAEPNPEIDFDAGPFYVVAGLRRWSGNGGPRRAGVSSFGVGGTNVHAVLEEAPAPEGESPASETARLLPLSARSAEALRASAERWASALAGRDGETGEAPAVADACYTAGVGRAHFEHRLAVVGESGEELADALDRYAAGDRAAVAHGVVSDPRGPEVAFLFPGQGAQKVGLGRDLYAVEPVVREVLDRCDGLLRDVLERPLLSVMFGEGDGAEETLRRTEYAQPALFALEVALAALWRSWGVEPAAVIGHSVGEIAAACVAGALELEDGLRLIAARGRRMGELPEGGAMASVMHRPGLSDAVAAVLERAGEGLSLAADNGAGGMTLSGDEEALEGALASLSEQGFKSRRLAVSHAFHSARMEPMLEGFAEDLEGVEHRPASIDWISCLRGERVGADELLDAEHWVRHVREPVRFGDGMAALADLGVRSFVEVGPGTTLSGMGRRCLESRFEPGDGEAGPAPVWLPSLRPGRPERRQMLHALGTLYTRGVSVDWSGTHAGEARRRISMPTYPFQRREHWIEPEDARPARGGAPVRSASDSGRVLPGVRLRSPLRQVQYEALLGAEGLEFLADHCIGEVPVLPATAYLEAALGAAADLETPRSSGGDRGAVELRNLIIHEPLVHGDVERALQLVVEPRSASSESRGDGGATYEMLSTRVGEDEAGTAPEWRLHVRGEILPPAGDLPPDAPPESLEALRAACPQAVDPDGYYGTLDARGLRYGSAFRGIHELWRPTGAAGSRVALARIIAPEAIRAELGRFCFHPALLDACLQPVGAALGLVPEGAPGESGEEDVFLPMGLDRLVVDGPPAAELWSHVQVRGGGGDDTDPKDAPSVTADYVVFDDAGTVIARVDGLRLKRSSAAVLSGLGKKPEDWVYGVEWRPAGPAGSSEPLQVRPVPAIAEHALERLPELRREHGLDAFTELEPALDALCAAYARRALEDLGIVLRPGTRITCAADELGVVRRHRRLFGRLVEMLEEDGALTPDGEGWRVADGPESITDPDAEVGALTDRFPQGRAVLRLIARCGPRLSAVLQGEEDPLELLFPGGDAEVAADLYVRSPAARGVNGLVRAAVAAVVEDLPEDRTLRVLEIGAGTGGTTAALLDVLPEDRTDYLFTDVSGRFTARAEETFRDVPFLRTRTFDVEGDPAAQGLGGERFDLVVAANVLHATRDLSATLSNVGGLLAPGGVLAMVEASGRQRWADVTFGLTEGWWLFEDAELRPDYPLLEASSWCDLLADCGYGEPVALPSAGETEGFPRQAVILAAAPEVSAAGAGDWLILGDRGGVGERLVAELEAAGKTCVTAWAGESRGRRGDRSIVDPGSADDLRWLVEEGAGGRPWEGVVHLWSLDAPAPESADLQAVARAQRTLCGGTLHLTQALATGGTSSDGAGSPRLFLVTRGAQPVDGGAADPIQAPLWGLGRVIVLEHPELGCTRIDLDPARGADDVRVLASELLNAGAEDQIGLRAGERRVARLVRAGETLSGAEPEEPYRLRASSSGTLDGVGRERLVRRPPTEGEVEVAVRAAGVNFKDVLNALGMFGDGTTPLGGECAGIVSRVGDGIDDLSPGDRVIALAPGCFGSFVTTPRAFVAPIPEGVSAPEAATLPMAFLTARHGLVHRAGLAAGERVLIHSASGGVGLAAVQIARERGAEVLATAGTPAKRAYLRDEIGIEHVMDSRSVEFADRVLEVTGGDGVDVVLNALTGEAIRKGLEILAPGGRFVEIGRTELWSEDEVRAVRDDVEYLTFDLAEEALEDPDLARGLLREMGEALAAGGLRPLPMRSVPMTRAVDALRTMQQARHVGKLVLTRAPAAPAEIDPEGTYLVTGGLGGLGLLVARRLVDRGARHLVLAGRSGAALEDTRARVEELRDDGAEVVVERADVTDPERMADVIGAIGTSMPPLEGVIHAAGVLDDGVLAQQTWERFERVLGPKVLGAWNLHRLVEAEELDFFVLFASTASLLGSPGQANHAAANAFLDALAHHRHAAAAPALSIDWGAWGEVGAAVERDVGGRLALRGMTPIPPELGLELFDRLATPGRDLARPRVGVFSVDWRKLAEQGPAGRGTPYFEAVEARSAADRSAAGESATGTGAQSGGALLRALEAVPSNRRRKVLRDQVRDRVVSVLGLDPSVPIAPDQSLDTLGLDSLIAVELRNALGEAAGATLPATLLFDYPTIDALTEYLADEVLGLEDPGSTAEETGGAEEAVDDLAGLDALSDDEAEELLAEELVGIDRLLGDD